MIEQYAPHCRGIVLHGRNQPVKQMKHGFKDASASHWVRGFAIYGTIFYHPAEEWFAEKVDDAQLIEAIAERFKEIITLWQTR